LLVTPASQKIGTMINDLMSYHGLSLIG